MVLNYDDSATRRTVEMCYRTHKTLVNPIIDWTDEDVWQFIEEQRLLYCPLYDEGWKRLGCVGCPMGGEASMRKQFERWPAIRRIYIKAFEDCIKALPESGLKRGWKTGEDVMRWWLKTDGAQQLDGQVSIFDEEEGHE